MTQKEKDSVLEELRRLIHDELKSEIKKIITEELSVEKICMTEEIKSEVTDYVKEHLRIDVDGYYEAYSGQGDHYHKVTIDFI